MKLPKEIVEKFEVKKLDNSDFCSYGKRFPNGNKLLFTYPGGNTVDILYINSDKNKKHFSLSATIGFLLDVDLAIFYKLFEKEV